jgi:hypothetical protein
VSVSSWAEAPAAERSPDLLMAHLGSLASNAQGEAEAEAFLGALVPLAAHLAPAVARVAPTIVRGVSRVGGQLWRNPSTRRLVRTIPTVVQRTTADLAGQYARGRPITPTTATRTLARNVQQVLGSPNQRQQAVRSCQVMDRRWHAAVPAVTGRPPLPQPTYTAAGPPRCTCDSWS